MDRDYELFVAVVQEGSLAGAGRRLRISAAMVSKRLARLEARLGGALLHRTTRRLMTTSIGDRLYRDMVGILATIEEAERRASGKAGAIVGPLKISAPTSFGRMHVAPHLAAFGEAYPGVDLELHLSDDYIDLIASRTDVVIRIGEPSGSGLETTILGRNYRLLCASPDYVRRYGEPVDLAALRRHRILAATGQLPWRLEGPAGSVAIGGKSWVRTNSSEVVRELVLSGVGIALRSLWDVGRDLNEGRLVRVLPEVQGDPKVAVFAGHLRTADVNPVIRGFVAFFRERLANLEPSGNGLSAA